MLLGCICLLLFNVIKILMVCVCMLWIGKCCVIVFVILIFLMLISIGLLRLNWFIILVGIVKWVW